MMTNYAYGRKIKISHIFFHWWNPILQVLSWQESKIWKNKMIPTSEFIRKALASFATKRKEFL